MTPAMMAFVVLVGIAALLGPRAARFMGVAGAGDRGSRASVRWLASRGAGVRQIARRTGLPQDVVSMLLDARALLPPPDRQKVPEPAGSALSSLPRPHSVKRTSAL